MGGSLIPVKNPSRRPLMRLTTKFLSGCPANSISSLSMSIGVRVAVCQPIWSVDVSHCVVIGGLLSVLVTGWGVLARKPLDLVGHTTLGCDALHTIPE